VLLVAAVPEAAVSGVGYDEELVGDAVDPLVVVDPVVPLVPTAPVADVVPEVEGRLDDAEASWLDEPEPCPIAALLKSSRCLRKSVSLLRVDASRLTDVDALVPAITPARPDVPVPALVPVPELDVPVPALTPPETPAVPDVLALESPSTRSRMLSIAW